MKQLLVILSILFSSFVNAQTVKDCNIYPSNLEENMYFEGYDDATRTIKNLHFMVLSDGDNSKSVTNAFTVKLYLYQQGKEPIFFKTIEEPGIYHFGKKEYKMNVSFKDVEVEQGTYRLGIFVNADKTVTENESDNAMLFQGNITIGKSSKNSIAHPFENKKEETGEKDESEGDDAE